MKTTNSKDIVVFYYIGDEFYHESHATMSSIYRENGTKSDWKKVHFMMEKGKNVLIRQATYSELIRAHKQLNEYKSRQSANRAKA